MNIDNLHDALGLLDDDMIEEVERLRDMKTLTKKKHGGTVWIRWISVAACLCVIFFSAYMGSLWLRGFDTQKADIAPEMKDESIEKHSSTQNESAQESPTVLVKIQYWQENGFVGTITEIVDTEKYAVGTEVIVKFDDSIYVEVSSKVETEYTKTIPDSTDFPAGSVVSVQFHAKETDSLADEATKEIVLYAESVEPIDEE